jgi:transcriptional regulator with XRE-family HTH domain
MFRVVPKATYLPDPALGQVLREIREREPKQSQEHVGFNAGVTAATIGRMEMSTSKPEWGTVRAVADALGVSLVELATAIEEVEGKR